MSDYTYVSRGDYDSAIDAYVCGSAPMPSSIGDIPLEDYEGPGAYTNMDGKWEKVG